MNGLIVAGGVAIAAAAVAVVLTLELPPVETEQLGYRGLAMEQLSHPATVAALKVANQVPAPIDPVEPSGTKSSEVYQNVQVLGDVDSDEFIRLMSAITEWVSPEQGCAYCHADGEELSSDSLYTKVVARRMLQMTKHINTEWQPHVGATGVTCFTCHRGKNVPQEIWFKNPGPEAARGMAGNHAGQNSPAPSVAFASLPFDPFTPFLEQDNSIRVVSTTALPDGNRKSIKQTEWTYGLMMHMSEGLGVNCTYCHNSRSFATWDQSRPQRSNAWYGIRMARDLNVAYLNPLQSTYPHSRLGPLGDAPKANCATCHQGVAKPLYGVNMLKDYPELGPTSLKAASAE